MTLNKWWNFCVSFANEAVRRKKRNNKMIHCGDGCQNPTTQAIPARATSATVAALRPPVKTTAALGFILVVVVASASAVVAASSSVIMTTVVGALLLLSLDRVGVASSSFLVLPLVSS